MAEQIQIVGQPSPQDVSARNETLCEIQAVFPFQLFPDSIILDRFKVNVVKRDFIASERITTIPLSGSISVKVNKSPFFSTVEISDSNTGASTKVTHLPNEGAMHFKELVEGIVVGINQGVSFMSMSRDEILNSAVNWGAVKPDVNPSVSR